MEEYGNNTVQQLKQWIANYKTLFQANKLFRIDNRKISDSFGRNNSQMTNKITTSISKPTVNSKSRRTLFVR